jgi:hypothetical protein
MASFVVFPQYSSLSAVNAVVPGADTSTRFAVDEFEHHQGWGDAQVTVWISWSGSATIYAQDIGISLGSANAPGELLEVTGTGSGNSVLRAEVLGTAALRTGFKIWAVSCTYTAATIVALQFDEV